MNGRYKKLWRELALNRFIRGLIRSCSLMRSLWWLKAVLRFRRAMSREIRWFRWIRIRIIHRFGWIRLRIIHRFGYKIICGEVLRCRWVRAKIDIENYLKRKVKNKLYQIMCITSKEITVKAIEPVRLKNFWEPKNKMKQSKEYQKQPHHLRKTEEARKQDPQQLSNRINKVK